MQYKRGENVSLSTHFSSHEFDCHCTDPNCTTTQIDPDLITKLEALREKAGALRITSGYRCAFRQAELRSLGYETATGISQHECGRAADVAGANTGFLGEALEKLASEAGFKAIGVGRNWVHVDLRADKERVWYYKT